jgi:predicted metal-dependent phosphoesterase TrpH
MKIDLHVHTSERSECGCASEEEQVNAAIASGLDAIVFTDHEQLAPIERLVQLNKTYAPFRVFGGIELGINGEHLLVLGINDERLVSTEWSYGELHTFCRARGGFIALAHPFRFHPDIKLDTEQYPLDAIEAYSKNMAPEAAGRIIDLASRWGIHALSNSDAHTTDIVGRYYNVLNRTPADERELIDALKQGDFTTAQI